jgi:murein DD-endopeptidase MepM/ murein hydrolase activator NlpD
MKKKYIFIALIFFVLILFISQSLKAMSKNNTSHKLRFPLGNYPRKVTSPFGYRTKPYEGFHNGVDFAAPIGTPIFAPANGKVIEWFETPKGGLQMKVQHDNGIVTGYAHLSKRIADEGQIVLAGEKIAEVGNTGIGTGAHLHFTVTINGAKVDPLLYV